MDLVRSLVFFSCGRRERLVHSLSLMTRFRSLGQKQTCAAQEGMSALPPNSDRESGFPQTVMSALPSKADMCGALGDVCFGPIADMEVTSVR